MVAPVQWVTILLFAYFAHFEELHRSIFAVIRQIIDDRIAHTTMGTGDEGVDVAAVGGVKKLSFTLTTDADIGRDAYCTPPLSIRLDDTKIIKLSESHRFKMEMIDSSKRGKLGLDSLQKRLHCFRCNGNDDLHPFRAIGDSTTESVTFGKCIDKRTETHTLDSS
jgi:hypothetical protein